MCKDTAERKHIGEEKTLFVHEKTFSDSVKRIEFRLGDITETDEQFDLIVVSAFRNNYYPVPGSVIGALHEKKNISVESLAEHPEIDLRKMGCWLSEEIKGADFKRLACVELLPLSRSLSDEEIDERILKSAFVTFRYILEQCAFMNISIERVVLPILGSGYQKIQNSFIAAPLFTQCMAALRDIPGLKEIVFYEKDEQKLNSFLRHIRSIIDGDKADRPRVFISYSSRQQTQAHDMCAAIRKAGYSCWIAPESIPPGSDYLQAIPAALGTTELLVVLLTQDAMQSPWVNKEISTAVGSKHVVIPYQTEEFELDERARFLMNGIQIYPAWKVDDREYRSLTERVRENLEKVTESL